MRFRCLLPLLCLSAPAVAQTDYAAPRFDSAGAPADRLAGYLRTLAVNPRDVEALTGAGRAAMDVGDNNAAIGFYARADGLTPRNGRIKAGLAAALLRMGKAREASRLFDQAVDLGVPESEIASDRGLAWDLRGDPKKAQRDYALARAGGVQDDETTRRLALSMGISGDRDGAIQLLTPLLYRKDAGAWRARAFVLAMTGDAAGAQTIAASVMPAMQAQAMQPFLARLAALSPEQKARAVTFGEMPSDGTTYSQAELARYGGAREGGYRPETAEAIPTAPPRMAVQRPTAAWMRERARLLRQPPAEAPATIAAAPLPAPLRPATAPALPAFGTATQAPASRPVIAARPGFTPPASRIVATPATGVVAFAPPALRSVAVKPPAVRPADDALLPIIALRPPTTTSRVRTALATPHPTVPAARLRQVDDGLDPDLEGAKDGVKRRANAPAAKPGKGAPAEAEATPAARGKARHGKAGADEADAAETTRGTARRGRAEPEEKAGGRKGKATDDAKPAGKGARDADDKAVKTAAKDKGKAAKDRAAEDRAAKAAPERVWVQVAGGANKDDLPKAWDAARTKNAALLKGRAPSTTKVRATNRLLVGPFKTDEEAQALVNKLPGAFIVRTTKGQAVEKLPAASK